MSHEKGGLQKKKTFSTSPKKNLGSEKMLASKVKIFREKDIKIDKKFKNCLELRKKRFAIKKKD